MHFIQVCLRHLDWKINETVNTSDVINIGYGFGLTLQVCKKLLVGHQSIFTVQQLGDYGYEKHLQPQ